MTERAESAGEGCQSEKSGEAATRSVGRDDLDECWCCGGLHDAAGSLCPDCDGAGCQHFGGGCESDHQPVLPDGGVNERGGSEHETNFLQEAIHGRKPIDAWLGRCSDCSHEWAVWLEVGEEPGWGDCPSCGSEQTVFELEEENKILPPIEQASNRVERSIQSESGRDACSVETGTDRQGGDS